MAEGIPSGIMRSLGIDGSKESKYVVPYWVHWVKKYGEEVSERSLYNGFNWVNSILRKGSRFHKFMMLFVNVSKNIIEIILPEKWLVENDVCDVKVEVKGHCIDY